jgi:hypothetical protein
MTPVEASRDWHNKLRQWAKPPSETEDQKASNAERIIREAIRGSSALQNQNIDVYATGSYRNNTNARAESDVDIAVVFNDVFFYDDLPQGFTPEILEFRSTDYDFSTFRANIGAALQTKFGRGVTPGKKAFDVHENSYRLDADVSAFFQHRRYTGRRNIDGSWHYHEGVEMRPQGVPKIINWHQQHYDEGVSKNDATGRRFKRITRILKRLRTEMSESRVQTVRDAALPIASFLIESMVYNVPHNMFNQAQETYYEDAKQVIGWLWNKINNNEHTKFLEVSGLKWLFQSNQPWTSGQAKTFLSAAWNYVGFGNE